MSKSRPSWSSVQPKSTSHDFSASRASRSPIHFSSVRTWPPKPIASTIARTTSTFGRPTSDGTAPRRRLRLVGATISLSTSSKRRAPSRASSMAVALPVAPHPMIPIRSAARLLVRPDPNARFWRLCGSAFRVAWVSSTSTSSPCTWRALPTILTRIIREGVDSGRDTRASVWYKRSVHKRLATTEAPA